MKSLVFGSCNLDYTYLLDHIVQPGETQLVKELRLFPGGKGLNQAIALRKAGAECSFAGRIGEDGRTLSETLENAGVDTRYLATGKTRTGQAIIQVDEQGRNSILVYAGANRTVTEAYIDEVLSDFGEGDMMLIQNEIGQAPYLCRKAAERGVRVVLNPSPFDEELRQIDLGDVFSVILNETESMQWTRSDDPYEIITLAQKQYPNLMVVLTLGENGSVCLHKGTVYRQPAFSVEAVDTTAAGDTFTGFFAAGIIRGDTVEKALKTASAASAIAVSREGASVSVPTAAEVEERLPEMKERS